MLIEDMLIYGGIGLGTIGFLLLIAKGLSGNKKPNKQEKAERSWTLTPPTSALGVSKMKNTANGLKGVQKKNILVEKPKNKAVNWKDTGSFEEDVGQINLDALMVKKTKKVSEIEGNTNSAFEKRSHKQESGAKNINPSSKQEYKIKVLLVDDSAVILKKTGDMLRANFYEVVTKKDGSDAIIWLEENLEIPDIVITDMEMPKMTGDKLVEAMRADERLKDIPVLVISAHAEKHIGLMEKQMIQGFLKKPFTESDLVSQLDFFLSQ